jgi:SSS family solute:Na+ symporter
MVSTVATAVFVVYMLGVLGIGIYASRFTQLDPSDYYLADRRIGTLVLLFTLMATIVSSFAFFGIGAASSATGLGVFSFIGLEVTLFALVFATLGLTINRVGREHDIITPSEYLDQRYESPATSGLYLAISFVALLGFVTAQITGGAIALDVLLDVPFEWGAVAIAVFMAVYIHIAGMRGVIWSDLVQGAVIVATLVLLMIAVLIIIGPAELLSGVQGAAPPLLSYEGPIGLWTPRYVLSFALFFVVGVTAYPQVYQRLLAAKDGRILRRSSKLFPIVGVPLFFAAVALGVWSTGIISNPSNPDYVIPFLIEEVTGPVVTGIAMSAAVASLMSTTDSVVLTLGSMASRDIYRKYVDPDASDRAEVLVGQAVLLLVIGVSLVLSFLRPAGNFALAEFAVAGFAATAPALFLGLDWERSTEAGAVVSMLVAVTVMLGFFLETIPATYRFGLHYGFVGLLLSGVVFVVVSAATSAPSEDTVRSFVPRAD